MKKRLSEVIGDLYNKYLPLAENQRVSLDVNFGSTPEPEDLPDDLEAEIEHQLQKMIQNSATEDTISLEVKKGKVIISDTASILSPALCALLSHGRVFVKSRLGFGTTVEIDTEKRPEDLETTRNTKVITAKNTKKSAKSSNKSKTTRKTEASKKLKTTKTKKSTKKS